MARHRSPAKTTWHPTLAATDSTFWRQWVETEQGVHLADVPPGAAAFLIAAVQAVLQRPVVAVVDGPRAIDDLARDLTALRGEPTACYPPWESLPGRGQVPLADLLGARLEVLQACVAGTPPPVLCTSVQALMQKTRRPTDWQHQQCPLRTGEDYAFTQLLETLDTLGYTFEPEVHAKGEAAHRGGIVDCWPPTEDYPLRLEFFGDTLESIRVFDPADQRSIDSRTATTVWPAREFQSDSAKTLQARVIDYCPPASLFVWCDADRIRDHAVQYEQLMADTAAADFIVGYRQLRQAIKQRFPAGPIYLDGHQPRGTVAGPMTFEPLAGLPALDRAELDQSELENLRHQFVAELEAHAAAGDTVRCYFGTVGTRERFEEWHAQRITEPTRLIHTVGPLSQGFHYPADRLWLVAEQDIYGQTRRGREHYEPRTRRRAKREPQGPRITEWRDIQPGELVVHIDHGIGRYLGLYQIETQGQRQEVLSIEYADEARIYLPVAQAHLLSRYVGFGKQRPDLHALGGKRWTREKAAAERAVRDLAANLLETQALRQTKSGHAFAADAPWQHEFEQAFPFEETEDQARAIQDVKNNMESARPMDRLICGDVGYGKTEVAMRAAFKTVMDGRQVALLVPTTVLAQQHYETFRERMAAFPVRIEMLSRFRTRGEQKQIVDDLNAGRLDIVIGTHRLVQPDVQFKQLGLVIVDEEQRFGVEHKEHLKSLRQLVDVLTLTATPIPRTLYMSLTGARDISTIQSPPQERLPVETIVTQYRDEIVRDAIRRELSREGQVFYLHNRVKTIERTLRHLQKLVPEARIAVGHGRMHERELEAVMNDFVQRRYDILLCTTIIESGVDIPNVNTILIERADRFGLSDLYQLRGRVGRYKHKAYAYLLLPRHGRLFTAAQDRVRAIRAYSGLGSGFKLAMRDLEIRGAGNILGAAQSGHIAAVGFDLYCQFLKRTIAQLKGEAPPPIIQVDLRLDFIDPDPANADSAAATVIPPAYVDDEHARVTLYRRIAALSAEMEVTDLRTELKDRYGPVPPALDRLLKIATLKIRAHACQVDELEVRDGKIMMKRNGQWCMSGHRFPRLQTQTPTARLDELLTLLPSNSRDT